MHCKLRKFHRPVPLKDMPVGEQCWLAIFVRCNWTMFTQKGMLSAGSPARCPQVSLASAALQTGILGGEGWRADPPRLQIDKGCILVQLDEIEAEERAERRRIQIEAANKMLYEDADKPKAFRSKLLLSDVMQEQAAQREYAAQIKALRRQQDEEFLKQMWAGLKVGGHSAWSSMASLG